VKVKLDENIPASVASRLVQLGVDADTVLGEGLGGRPDADVWSAAQSEERLLVTQDLGFSDIRIFKPGTHHGLLLVRLPDSEQWRVGDYVCAWLSAPESPSWSGCVVVATKNKVRVRRP
jgi:predicted nuclease of predicted toxin-antitoxin system